MTGFRGRVLTPFATIEEETRRDVRTLIKYLDGWLSGRGACGIDTLAGRPGIHPALIDDLATARISVAQTAQRIRHGARWHDTGARHHDALIASVIATELAELAADKGQHRARTGRARRRAHPPLHRRLPRTGLSKSRRLDPRRAHRPLGTPACDLTGATPVLP